MHIRRVTIYQDRNGEWRYRAQAGNWRIVEAAEEGFKQKRTVLNRIAAKFGDVEIVEL